MNKDGAIRNVYTGEVDKDNMVVDMVWPAY